jgi:hypothetical protein
MAKRIAELKLKENTNTISKEEIIEKDKLI